MKDKIEVSSDTHATSYVLPYSVIVAGKSKSEEILSPLFVILASSIFTAESNVDVFCCDELDPPSHEAVATTPVAKIAPSAAADKTL